VHVPLNDNELRSLHPSVLGILTQHTWSVALTTVEGIFWRKNGSGSLWGNMCNRINLNGNYRIKLHTQPMKEWDSSRISSKIS